MTTVHERVVDIRGATAQQAGAPPEAYYSDREWVRRGDEDDAAFRDRVMAEVTTLPPDGMVVFCWP